MMCAGGSCIITFEQRQNGFDLTKQLAQKYTRRGVQEFPPFTHGAAFQQWLHLSEVPIIAVQRLDCTSLEHGSTLHNLGLRRDTNSK